MDMNEIQLCNSLKKDFPVFKFKIFYIYKINTYFSSDNGVFSYHLSSLATLAFSLLASKSDLLKTKETVCLNY
jgi:hypothetical protein